MAQEKYFATFSCVEIDASFYQLPKVETATRWRNTAPGEFQFTMKAWQLITHPASCPTYKRTRLDPRDREYCGNFGFNPTVRWAWDQTYVVAKALRAALVLFQCPASFRQTDANIARLKQFFGHAKRGKFLMGWEPRGEWDPAVIADLCKELDLIHVVDPFKSTPAARGEFQYFRLHGISGTRHRFSDAELQRVKQFCTGKTRTYCLFNNVAMATDAKRFAALV